VVKALGAAGLLGTFAWLGLHGAYADVILRGMGLVLAVGAVVVLVCAGVRRIWEEHKFGRREG